MLQRKALFGAACVFTAAVTLSALAGDSKKYDTGKKKGDRPVEIGQKAPGFTLEDLEGNERSLSDFEGKIVVLEWTNRRCPYVVHHWAKAKTHQNTWAKYNDRKEEDVVWLAIDSSHYCDDQRDEIKKFVKECEISTPVLLDPEGVVGKKYGAMTTPHIFVIDKEGKLVYDGAIDSDADPFSGDEQDVTNYVAAAVDALLADKEVKTTRTKPYGCSVKYAKKDKKS